MTSIGQRDAKAVPALLCFEPKVVAEADVAWLAMYNTHAHAHDMHSNTSAILESDSSGDSRGPFRRVSVLSHKLSRRET